ncbi:coenzyme F420-0:L-glutamate ligase [Candidatus Peregrinibacteria bacterium]|nr:coenzyme F420-0:L-glutamate ligase [Candidatus Peregrinibacteria bacterium]
MELLPVHTPILRPHDDLASMIATMIEQRDGDIVVLSSKAVATVEGAMIDLSSLKPGQEAIAWSEKTGRSAEFCEAVLRETQRLHGEIVGHCSHVLLTELHPEGLSSGSILTANAGLDESNVAAGFAIGWPRDPVGSVGKMKRALMGHRTRNKEQGTRNNCRLAVILTDSCVRPRRLGVTAFALAVSGMDPLASQIGKLDLFGKPLHITIEAVADQLAVAANFLMGNAGQSIPAVIVRDHGLALSDSEGWVPGISREGDLFGDCGGKILRAGN